MQCGVENCCADAEKKTTEKILYLDVLRVIACLFVIVIHASSDYAVSAIHTADFWVGHFFDSIARAAVPLFVMISGALMLDEQRVMTKQKWIGHIKKMAIFYFGWSVIYCAVFKLFWMVAIGHMEIKLVHIADMIGAIINGHTHLWFVPMIIGLYLLLPLLRLWVKRANMKYVEYFLLLSAAVAFVIPQAMTLLSMAFPMVGKTTLFENLGMEHCMGYVAYFILGWYLNNKDFKHIKPFYLIAAAAVLVTFGATYVMMLLADTNRYIFYGYFSVSVWLNSAAIFVLCREKLKRVRYSDTLMCRGVSFIAKNSLGVYAVHFGLLHQMPSIFRNVHVSIAIPSMIVLTLVLSIAVTTVMRKIPVVKELV